MSTEPKSSSGARALFVLVTVLLLAPIATGSLSLATASGEEEVDSFYREFSVFTEVLEHIRKRYVEETGLDALFAGAFDGAVDALDPIATYVPPDAVSSYRQALTLSYERSGIRLVRDRGYLFVVGVAEGSPADVAGLESGDILSKLNGISTRQTSLWEAQVALSGEPGTVVTAEVLRQGRMEEFELTLGAFDSKGASLEMRDGVAIVKPGHFSESLPEQLADLLAVPEVIAGGRLIVDLRSVAGGDLAAALAAADLFVDGSLGQLKERSEVVQEFASARERIWTGRLVLVTDRGSQGASEVFAVVLKQLADAAVVGGATFGHAGRSASRTLSNGGELYYTDAFYVAPDGTVLNETLAPDVRVTDFSRRLGEAELPLEDLVIERALEIARESDEAAKEAA